MLLICFWLKYNDNKSQLFNFRTVLFFSHCINGSLWTYLAAYILGRGSLTRIMMFLGPWHQNVSKLSLKTFVNKSEFPSKLHVLDIHWPEIFLPMMLLGSTRSVPSFKIPMDVYHKDVNLLIKLHYWIIWWWTSILTSWITWKQFC